MKRISIIVSSILVISCNSKPPEKILEEPEKVNFDFLIGKWKRINDSEGKETFENWKKLNDSTYMGHSFTLQKSDTIWQENVKLSPIENEWFYQVSIPSENQSTNFKLINKTDSSLVCENQQNEFPKEIKYWKNGVNNFTAEISDDKSKILYEFKKL